MPLEICLIIQRCLKNESRLQYGISKRIFVYETNCTLSESSLKFIPKRPVIDKAALA